jgi:NAD+--asparagine ADP-ribosyltransferase
MAPAAERDGALEATGLIEMALPRGHAHLVRRNQAAVVEIHLEPLGIAVAHAIVVARLERLVAQPGARSSSSASSAVLAASSRGIGRALPPSAA